MKNPYDILGVSKEASEEEIKKAYRNLSRKYHPDANVNNPNRERAEERFKEVQQAYQRIMDEKTNASYAYGNRYGGFGEYSNFGGFGSNAGERGSGAYGDDKEFTYLQAAITYVQNGDYQSALRVLSDIENRSGRWYYISAAANRGAGNQAVALEHIQIAMRMEPGNVEYQRFYSALQNGSAWYAGRGTGYGMPNVSNAGFCFNLCLANILCNLCCNGACCPGFY